MLTTLMRVTARRGSSDPGSDIRSLLLLLLWVPAACAKTDEQWVHDLDSTDAFVRSLAAIGLSVQSPREAGVALPELLRTIDRKDVGLGREAAAALHRAGPFHVPLLLDHLVEEELMSDDRRGAIKNALVAAGSPAVSSIVGCMRGRGSHLVGDLGDVLIAIGEPSVPATVEMLEEEEDVRLRTFAAFLLARFDPAARSALPALRAATSSPDAGLRKVAEEAIRVLEGQALPDSPPAGDAR